jgi:hypothetical protein
MYFISIYNQISNLGRKTVSAIKILLMHQTRLTKINYHMPKAAVGAVATSVAEQSHG